MNQAGVVLAAIAAYAQAYKKLEQVQNEWDLIPRGDQKTGCIGECYALLYVRSRFPKAEVRHGKPNESGWDIEAVLPEHTIRFQVKTASAYSGTGTLSPILPGWGQLLLIYLNRDFTPEGFWILEDNSIMSRYSSLRPLQGRRCPLPEVSSSGSAMSRSLEDRVAELNEVLQHAFRG